VLSIVCTFGSRKIVGFMGDDKQAMMMTCHQRIDG